MKIIANMSEEEKREYFNHRDEYGHEFYYDDIQLGKIHIAEVPFEYRTSVAYCYAVWAALAFDPKTTRYHILFSEKKILENLFISDITRLRAEHRINDANLLSQLYWDYFEVAASRWPDLSEK